MKAWNQRVLQQTHERRRLEKLTLIETRARLQGWKEIAGIDEAGRGPLAGPVVAASCIIGEGIFFEGINDSKLLSPAKRLALFHEITQHAHVFFAYSVVDVETIDRINILQATRVAMKESVEKLPVRPDCLLIDALFIAVAEVHQEKIIKGDQLSQSIAAASIIAKVVRDQIMCDLAREYPEYGFESHKGYGTKRHLEALAKYGPSVVHRKSFAPVRAAERGQSVYARCPHQFAIDERE